jgi:carboxypeptidase PM20D1
MIKKLLLVLLSVIVIIIIVLMVNTLRLKSLQPVFTEIKPIAVSDSAVAHFEDGIRFKTVSYGNLPPDSVEFTHFHQFLQKTYPLIFGKLVKKEVAKYTLIFKWLGKDTLTKPIILMAHQDVVPVEQSAIPQWNAAPFSASIKHGRIFGRGAADDKISLFGILEATERLLAEGYQPPQTVYFVFGHDEEVGGNGAKAAAAYLKTLGVKPAWVLDEGGEITEKAITGMKNKPVALIGTSEKGYLSLKLSVDIVGGHSSMPKAETAVDVLIKAVQNIRDKPFKARFSPSTSGTFNFLAPEMPFGQRIVVANRWLFEGLLISIYQQSPEGNALIRTTIAPTIIKAGVKDNVIPTNAEATINFRLLPGNTVDGVIKQVTENVNDSRVKIAKFNEMYSEASHVTPDTGAAFLNLAKTIRACFPGTIVAPLQCVGATDSRRFESMTGNVLRFSPVTDLQGMHGINENVGVDEFKKAVNFYYQLMKK